MNMNPFHKNLIISTAVFETLLILLPFCISESVCPQCITLNSQRSVPPTPQCPPPICILNESCLVHVSYCPPYSCEDVHASCNITCSNLKLLCQHQLTSYSSTVFGVSTSEPSPKEELSRTFSAIITSTYSSNVQKKITPEPFSTEAFNKSDSMIIGVIVSCLLLGIACIVILILWRRRIKRTPHLDKMSSQDSSVTIVRQSLAPNNDYDVIQWVRETQHACSETPSEQKDVRTSAKDYELLIEEDSETYEAIDDPDYRADTQNDTSVDPNKAGDNGKENSITNELDGLSHRGTQSKPDEMLNNSCVPTNVPNPYFVLESNGVTEPYFMQESASDGVMKPYFELESASTDVRNSHFVLESVSIDVPDSYRDSESQDKTSNDTENRSDFYSRLGKKKKIQAVNPYNFKLDDNGIVIDNNDNNARNENIDNNDNNNNNDNNVMEPVFTDVPDFHCVSESQVETSNDTENSSDLYSRLGEKNITQAVNPYNVTLDGDGIVSDNNENNDRNENFDNNDNNCNNNNSAKNDNNENNTENKN